MRRKILKELDDGKLRSLDGRSTAAYQYKKLYRELCDSLGGEKNLPVVQRLQIELACQVLIRCRMLSQHLIAGGKLTVNAERRYATWLSDARRILEQLGTAPGAPPKAKRKSLYDYPELEFGSDTYPE